MFVPTLLSLCWKFIVILVKNIVFFIPFSFLNSIIKLHISFLREQTLSISGLTVFKQEAPSPTHGVNGIQQLSRRNTQSPTSTQDVETGNALDENSSDQQILNSTISQLLNQSGYSTLHSAFDGAYLQFC